MTQHPPISKAQRAAFSGAVIRYTSGYSISWKVMIEAISLGLMATACASVRDIDRGLEMLVGLSNSEILERLGLPTEEARLPGATVYRYVTTRQEAVTGVGGRWGYLDNSYPVWGVGSRVVEHVCVLDLILDENKKVISYIYKAAMGACLRYAKWD